MCYPKGFKLKIGLKLCSVLTFFFNIYKRTLTKCTRTLTKCTRPLVDTYNRPVKHVRCLLFLPPHDIQMFRHIIIFASYFTTSKDLKTFLK